MPQFLRLVIRALLVVAVLAGSRVGVRAQVRPGAVPSSRRCVWVRVPPERDTTEFSLADTLTVVPSSVSTATRSVAYDSRTDRYRIIWPASRVASPEPGQPDLRLPTNRPDSVLICYRVLPMRLAAPVLRRPRRLMDSLSFNNRPFAGYGNLGQKEQILATPGINKTGSLTRGISFGNAQNVFVNSALNLQLEGKLTDKINLTAAISDQNVPFQPEGNTQQLQEFDRIYVTLTHPNWALTAGDVVLRNKPDYFLRFYKNIQGAAADVFLGQTQAPTGAPGALLPNPLNPTNPGTTGPQLPVTAPQTLDPRYPTDRTATRLPLTSVQANSVLGPLRSSTTVAAGVAKGKFASTTVDPIENVQGPYRLRGPNGEQFIIILANSERVYLDGRLLVRGFDNDYVIDYNTAELTFSPRHLITRNSRIRVDYEYSDFNYARSLYHLNHYQEVGRLQVHANYYREADNPDNSPNLNLSDQQKAYLRTIGDNVSLAATSGVDSLSRYDRRQIQYNRVRFTDPATGQQRWIFALLTDSTSRAYTVSFTDVGEGNGDYVLSNDPTKSNANGRVYEFVAPVGGVSRGRYRPERLLPTPLEKQLVTAGASYQVDSTTTVFVDLASSELDVNRFSPESSRGRAMRIGYAVQDRPLALPGLRGYRLRSAMDYEYTSRGFAPVDRYRDIEFDRNWSTGATQQSNTTGGRLSREDNIFNFAIGAVKDPNNSVNYRVSRRYRAGEVSGVQHWLDAAQKVGNLEWRGSLFLLGADAGRRRSTWARGETAVRYVAGAIVPGYAYRFDKNRVRLPSGDSLSSANYFDEHAVFVQSQDSAKTKYRVAYTYRRDRTPTADQRALQLRGVAQTWQGQLTTRIGRWQDLNVLATYRDLAARDSARQRTVLGQLSWNASLLQGQIRSELTYNVATGREPKRDYVFIPVPTGQQGQGTHYYAGDLNNNGRQDKDEFLEAPTSDAVYRTHIKVYLFTDTYVTAFTNRFGYRLTLSAPRSWREAKNWRATAARFSSISTVTLDRRTIGKSLNARLNPFAYQTNSPELLSLNKLLRNTVYFNRSNPTFGSELTVQQAQQKTLLAQGSETRNLASQSVLLRRTLAQSYTARLTGTRSIRENLSYLQGRNFRIEEYEVTPELSYQPTGIWRFTGTYHHTTKRNVLAPTPDNPTPDARGVFDELSLETRISQVGKRTLSGATSFVRVGFTGDVGSVVGLEILNALRPGNNVTWNLNLEQRLSNGLNITISYDGRKPNGLNAIHTGRMQASVLF
ncbi:hypothetical protein [Hymenobacter sp. CRA2]|uniref:hypothetical protein n=1 Tax=Hymenobacter sp. CRA2 TaxID=1955620 RepID=UPI00098FCD2D|nr:hypothetical protein [Hymenobacter sp. CRA2]OON69184.1 hypothetical protein B0919_10835 [Hymenobacter sp. CRA2]